MVKVLYNSKKGLNCKSIVRSEDTPNHINIMRSPFVTLYVAHMCWAQIRVMAAKVACSGDYLGTLLPTVYI